MCNLVLISLKFMNFLFCLLNYFIKLFFLIGFVIFVCGIIFGCVLECIVEEKIDVLWFNIIIDEEVDRGLIL